MPEGAGAGSTVSVDSTGAGSTVSVDTTLVGASVVEVAFHLKL